VTSSRPPSVLQSRVSCGRLGRAFNGPIYIYYFIMNAKTAVTVSPVNMKERAELGLRAGDTVRVHQKIQDKGKTRIQIFEGVVLARKHGDEPGATFTVRKVASGVGVEKIFPLYSPLIDKLEIVKRAKVRRSKLYYIREKVAREVKRQMRRITAVAFATESEAEAAARSAAEAKALEEAELKAKVEAEAVEKAKAEAEAAAKAAAEAPPVETPVEEVAEVAPVAETAPVSTETPAEEKKD
jgi:large subunit ribosomal protein L19